MNFLPKFMQRFVVVALLGVWFSPAVSAAVPVRSAPVPSFATAPLSPMVAQERTSQIPSASTTNEARGYAEREKQAPELEQFQGGFFIYIGGGALLILILVLLLVL
jgi:hypothetical protein